MSNALPMDREHAGNVEILRPRGEIDLSVSPSFRRALLDSLQAGRDVIVDMDGVAYIDSSGIASLAEALHTAKRRGRQPGPDRAAPAHLSRSSTGHCRRTSKPRRRHSNTVQPGTTTSRPSPETTSTVPAHPGNR